MRHGSNKLEFDAFYHWPIVELQFLTYMHSFATSNTEESSSKLLKRPIGKRHSTKCWHFTKNDVSR